ncbi:MAG TPA: hypothetical protein VJ858_02360, partial [Acidimicrobiia bacterium]|nr:hypothetical protein [Acidimicrobiia bacterium]
GDTGTVGPAGPIGPQGPQGEPGDPGSSTTFVRRTGDSVTGSPDSASATGSCQSGEFAVGGGGRVTGAADEVAITASYPVSDTQWKVEAFEINNTNKTWTLSAYVVCAK